MVQSAKWLLICAYVIGIFDLVSAVFFFLISLKTICNRVRNKLLILDYKIIETIFSFPAKLAKHFCSNIWPFLDYYDTYASSGHSWGISKLS